MALAPRNMTDACIFTFTIYTWMSVTGNSYFVFKQMHLITPPSKLTTTAILNFTPVRGVLISSVKHQNRCNVKSKIMLIKVTEMLQSINKSTTNLSRTVANVVQKTKTKVVCILQRTQSRFQGQWIFTLTSEATSIPR